MVNNPPANTGDLGSIPRSGRFPGEENGKPLQYSCPENPMDRGACVDGVAQSQTQLATKQQKQWLNDRDINNSVTNFCRYSSINLFILIFLLTPLTLLVFLVWRSYSRGVKCQTYIDKLAYVKQAFLPYHHENLSIPKRFI